MTGIHSPPHHFLGVGGDMELGEATCWQSADSLLWTGKSIELPSCLNSGESTCNAGASGDAGSILGLGRPPGVGHGNLLQDSCLGNPTDRGAWQAVVHGVTKS